MKDPIYSLFEKYINNTISSREREVLRSMINAMSDEQIKETLSMVWEDFEPENKAEHHSFEEFESSLAKKNTKRIIAPHFWVTLSRVAAVIALPIAVGFGIYMYNQASLMQSHLDKNFVFSTKSGDCSELILPDGTKVLLNSASTLSYPVNYGMNERRVSLSGEAFLEVKKDSLRAFILDVKELEVKVLGTSFNVKAYEESDYIETTLIEGSVEIDTKRNSKLTLRPNEKASYSRASGQLWREKSEGYYEKAWIDGSLVFRSSSFSDMMIALERYYGLTIRVYGKLPTEKFTGYIQEKNLWTVLKMLQNHYPFSYERDDDIITITMR
ncbi:MAG: FecR family protein [Bacteroidales bacterium]